MTIKYFIFNCFMDRLLISTSLSSSFITTSFLIQMLKMDNRLFKNWVLCIPHHLRDLLLDGESLIFSWSHILFSYYESSFFFFLESAKSNHFLLAHIPCMNGFPWSQEAIQGGYHHFCILHFFFYCYKLFFDLRDPRKVWLYGLCILDLHILQLFTQSHILIYVLPFK